MRFLPAVLGLSVVVGCSGDGGGQGADAGAERRCGRRERRHRRGGDGRRRRGRHGWIGRRGGTAGAGGTLAASVCPTGATYSGSTVPAGATPARIAAVLPKDAFNNEGANSFNIDGLVWNGDALYMSEILAGSNPPPARILKMVLPSTVTVVTETVGTTPTTRPRPRAPSKRRAPGMPY
jgi:hypothetical protein